MTPVAIDNTNRTAVISGAEWCTRLGIPLDRNPAELFEILLHASRHGIRGFGASMFAACTTSPALKLDAPVSRAHPSATRQRWDRIAREKRAFERLRVCRDCPHRIEGPASGLPTACALLRNRQGCPCSNDYHRALQSDAGHPDPRCLWPDASREEV